MITIAQLPPAQRLGGVCNKPLELQHCSGPLTTSPLHEDCWTQPGVHSKTLNLPRSLKGSVSTHGHADCCNSSSESFFCGSPTIAFRVKRSRTGFCIPRASNSDQASGSPQSEEPTFRVLQLRKQADSAKLDTADDADFYKRPRFVHHVDDGYREKLTALYRLRLREGSRVLDLMSSWVSHLPEDMQFEWVEGHGMNEAELLANTRLNHFWVQDLNKSCALPHENGSFDAVLISLGIQYLEAPWEVLAEVERVLTPQGLLIVTFSKHSYTEKAVAGWLRRSAEERLDLVRSMFIAAGFQDVETKSSSEGLENEEITPISDPFYAVVGAKSSTRHSRLNPQDDALRYDSLAFETLSRAEDVGKEDSSSILMETWANAYEMMTKEAMDLGIPRSAIPKLQQPMTQESVLEARDMLSAIIQSRMSSNL